MTFVNMGLLFIVLFIGYEVIPKRLPKIAMACFMLLPIALIPYWVKNATVLDLFYWVKLYSVMIACVISIVIRLTKLSNKKWGFWLMYSFLALNIAEATTTQIVAAINGNNNIVIPHIINALAGILLILTQGPVSKLHIDQKGRYKEFMWALPISWIIGYTLWNISFLYMCYPDNAGRNVSILLVPLFVTFLKKDTWFMARGYTLGIDLLILFSFNKFYESFIDTTPWYNTHIASLMGVFSFMWMACYCLSSIFSKRTVLRNKTVV